MKSCLPLPVFSDMEQFEKSDFLQMKSFHWEAERPYRPDVFFKVGVVGDTLKATLKCYEVNPRTVFTDRDAPIYRDSCLEFFVAPVNGRDEYINVEMNSAGAFLCEFGKSRQGRKLVSNISSLSPMVIPQKGADSLGEFWKVNVSLSREFIAELYGIDNNQIDYSVIKANFYKCGDDCETPHYVAFSPVSTLPPGFHNPECFAIFRKEIK